MSVMEKRMSRESRGRVAIVGAGCTKFGENFEQSYGDMIAEAAFEAFEESGLGPRDIEAAWLSTAFPDNTVYHGKAGHDLCEPLSLRGIPISRVSNFCGSAGDAVVNAAQALLSGRFKVVLAMGVEKMRDRSPRNSLVKMMVETLHPIYQKGFTAPGTFAVYANRMMERIGLRREHLAKISAKNHRFGVFNSKAQYGAKIGPEDILKSPMVVYPLTVMDCCPTTDGAACVIMMRTEDAAAVNREHILVRGFEMYVSDGWDYPYFDIENDFVRFRNLKAASKRLYASTGIIDPLREIHCAEVHDCFTINEAITYEGLGLVYSVEEIPGAIDDGIFDAGGKLPINTSGGLLSCGHPVGATGLRMIYAIKQQLQEKAGQGQVKNARLGLTENMGGPASILALTILERKD
jgi:acetyl-CoA C-acetyltransferase